MAIIGNRFASRKDSQRRLLKMFSGPSMGAEISLDAGEYLIGRDVGNDLIVNDRTVADTHLKIRIDADGVFVTPLTLPVHVDGKEIPARETRIDDYRVITLGTTHFALGPADAQWPVIGLPMIRRVASSAGTGESSSDSVLAVFRRRLAALTAAYPWLKWVGMGWGILVGLMLLATFGGVSGGGDSTQARDVIRETIAGQGLGDRVRIVEDDDGRPMITGYLRNEADRVKLERALAERGIDVPVAIWNPSALAESATSILGAMGVRHVRVRSGDGAEPGQLVMSGYYEDESRWKGALATVKADVPGVSSIDHQAVDPIETRIEALRALLVEKGLQDKLKVVVRDGTLIVSGALLTEDDQMRWESLVDDYRRLYLDEPPFVQTAAAKKKKLYIPIRSISIGDDISYLVTRDGRKYTEGSYIGEGFVIRKILADRILLARDGNTIEYLLEE